MALIDINEVKEMADKHLPKIALKNAGVQLLLKFVGRTVRAVNNLDERLKAVEKALNIKPDSTSSSEEGTNA